MIRHLRIRSPGLSSTVQDYGRVGYQRFGVPVSGAADRIALAAANTVAGNPSNTAGLEMLYQGLEFEVAGGRARLAVAGAGARLDITPADAGEPRRVEMLESTMVAPGDRVRVVIPGPGIAAYLAIEGGIDVPLVMGSRSTYARAGFGGFEGRALRAGDELVLAGEPATERAEVRLDVGLAPPTKVRIVPGPQDDYFSEDARQTLARAPYRVTPASDRMGLRFAGATLTHTKGYNIISDGIAPGAIQVPGDALPIVLMSDRQTTGGYPKIATVISADLPGLGRLGPGSDVRFEWTTIEAAEAARRALDAEIAAWPGRLVPVASGPVIDLVRLAEANLVSGVIDAVEGPAIL